MIPGRFGEFLEPRRGNKTYANNTEKRIALCKRNFLQGVIDFSVMFITLVTPYRNSFDECRASWRAMDKALARFRKCFKRKGLEGYFYSLEATSEGCCHAHILVKWDSRLKVNFRNGKYYLADEVLLKSFTGKWHQAWNKVSDRTLNNNAISIRVCPNLFEAEVVFDYVTKHLGRFSNITNALHRAKKNDFKDNDIKKLLTNFWAIRFQGIKLFGCSRIFGQKSEADLL